MAVFSLPGAPGHMIGRCCVGCYVLVWAAEARASAHLCRRFSPPEHRAECSLVSSEHGGDAACRRRPSQSYFSMSPLSLLDWDSHARLDTFSYFCQVMNACGCLQKTVHLYRHFIMISPFKHLGLLIRLLIFFFKPGIMFVIYKNWIQPS